jgi:SAM-dependent methyltransferase
MFEDLYTSGAYLKKNPTWHLEEAPWKAKQILQILGSNDIVPQTICEVGCGSGEILKLLQQTLPGECALWGYEISPQAFELCKDKSNEKLHFKLANIAQEKDVHFDLILVMDVLEHVEDYFSLLRDIQQKSEYKIFQLPLDISVRSVLRGDILKYRETWGHIHYFTKELALQTLNDVGYQVLDYFYSGQPSETIPIPWNAFKSNPRKLLRKILGRMKRSLLNVPVKLFVALNEDLTVRILGTSRLLILAK